VPDDALRVVVLGYVVRCPLGGLAWHHLQYALGLRALGHDVYFVEDSDDYPSCYDPRRNTITEDAAFGLSWSESVFERLGLGERWAYYDAHTGTWHGPIRRRAASVCRTADVVLNVSGVNPIRPWLAGVPVRALIDTDPAFTQVRHLGSAADAATPADPHTVHFTFGEGVAAGTSTVPDDGRNWLPTRQPIVLDVWPDSEGPADGPWTTVMTLEPYPGLEHQGVHYGNKAHSFRRYLDLPSRVLDPLELAVGAERSQREEFRRHGWHLRNALGLSEDPWTYREYIRSSKGEWSPAKAAYVDTRSGWFSERSAAYLASGRPVVTEDTGWSDVLPSGDGLHAFSEVEGAAAAIAAVSGDYAHHAAAAREVAVTYFDARSILTDLLARVSG
jgi:hypothetical protein